MTDKIGLNLPTYSYNAKHPALIIGAGLAGCAVAHALAKRGYRCTIVDQHATVAAATSAIPAAVIRPMITGNTLQAQLTNHAFDFCCNSLPKNIFIQCGLLQLVKTHAAAPLDKASMDMASLLCTDDASTVANTELESDAWHIKQAGWINPATLCNHWLDHPAIEYKPNAQVTALHQTEYGWQLLSNDLQVIDESSLVILANASDVKAFDQSRQLPISQIGGQIDYFRSSGSALRTIISSNRYIIPGTQRSDSQLIVSGATHHRDQAHSCVTAADTASNKLAAESLAPQLSLANNAELSFSGLRCATPDRLPMVGALPDTAQFLNDYRDLRHGRPATQYPAPPYHPGLYAAIGLGSRGATQAAYVGDLLAALISGDHAHASTLQSLQPSRFLIRQLRRGLAQAGPA